MVVGLIAAVGVLAAGCTPGGDDDDDAGKGPPEKVEDVTTTSQPVDQPPASDVGAVQPIIQDLVDGYAEAVSTILADPAIAGERGNETVAAFVALFEDGSDRADESLAAWQDYADEGTTLEPVSSDHPTVVVNIDGAVRRVSDDEVRFAICEIQRYVHKVDGRETERVDERLVPGTGEAVRVDGQWRLRSLDKPRGLQGCSSGTEGR